MELNRVFPDLLDVVFTTGPRHFSAIIGFCDQSCLISLSGIWKVFLSTYLVIVIEELSLLVQREASTGTACGTSTNHRQSEEA